MNSKSAEILPDSENAYDLIASHYDGFTAHHDNELWIQSLLEPLGAHGLSGSRLLDVGCGTGNTSIPMLKRGWQVTACDSSVAMLDHMRTKVGDTLDIEWADLKVMPILGEFDLILCLGDVLNHCAVTTPPSTALSGLKANLAPGGLLLFDLNTIHIYRTFFAEHQEVDVDGRRVTWQGLGDGRADAGEVSRSVMEIATLDGGEPIRATHRQRHIGELEARRTLDEAGLECLDVFGHGFDAVLEKPVDENRHTKMIFIAKARNHEDEGR